jgi:hypothetical protein
MLTPETSLLLGGVWGEVRCGQTRRASDGLRLVLTATSSRVVFVRLSGGQLYDQTARGFRGDVTTFPFADAARRLEPGRQLIELEAYFVLGILCGMSSVVAVSALLLSLARGVYDHRHDIPKWIAITAACLSARAVLQRHAPILYEKCVDALWLVAATAAGDILPRTPGSMSSHQIAKMVGVIIGKIGERGANAHLTAMSAVLTILLEFAKNCLTAIPAAAQRALSDHTAQAEQIVQTLREQGVSITREEAEQIFREVAAHPREIKEALEGIVRAARG